MRTKKLKHFYCNKAKAVGHGNELLLVKSTNKIHVKNSKKKKNLQFLGLNDNGFT